MLYLLYYVLIHVPSERHGEGLDASADAKHRLLAMVCHPGKDEFGTIPLRIYIVKSRHRVLTTPERIVVSAPCEEDSIDMFQCVSYDFSVSNGRNDDGNAACSDYLLIVFVAQCGVNVGVIGSDAYYRTAVCLWKSAVGRLQELVNGEVIHDILMEFMAGNEGLKHGYAIATA